MADTLIVAQIDYIIFIPPEKVDGMGGTYSAHRGKIMHIRFWLENLKGILHSDDLSINGSTIFKIILKKYCIKSWAVSIGEGLRSIV
jgi:hypothetical protein